MARPAARVLALLELLQSGGVRTVAELADRLGVDERTVRRYAMHLAELDIPVESVRGRYGGYRLAAGFRLPPLMLTDDEALAVLLGLVTSAGRGAAGETALAKIRRVLPERLRGRLDGLLEALEFTSPGRERPVPEGGVLLAVADAVRHRRPLRIRYTTGDRTIHPFGLVVHNGRWYVTGVDPDKVDPDKEGERTFRLDRIADARVLPGSFAVPDDVDPAGRVLAGLAAAPHRYEVVLRIDGTEEQIRTRLPAGLATIDDGRVTLRVESLDWLPGVLAQLDLPFVVERPAELRERVAALARRLAESAAREPQHAPGRAGSAERESERAPE